MPSMIRTQISLERVGALPEDAIVNVLHWFATSEEAPVTLAPELATRIEAFYDLFGNNWTSDLITGNVNLKVYDLENPEPRPPIFESTFTVVHGGPPFPAEVALCLSMEGPVVAGVNMARRRGRVFLGPLASTTATNETVGGDARPKETMRTALLAGAEAMAKGATADLPVLQVFSPTTLIDVGGTLANSMFPVQRFWIDNAYDTQRRRGARPTSRATITVA